MRWEKKEPIKGGHGSCLNCGYQYDIAPIGMLIAVGFGNAVVIKNGTIIYDEMDCMDESDMWTVADAEKEAVKDPDNDWRIILDAPLSGRTYQRHGDKEWVLIERNNGFA